MYLGFICHCHHLDVIVLTFALISVALHEVCYWQLIFRIHFMITTMMFIIFGTSPRDDVDKRFV